MSENAATVTTRQAAELLNVHESSIKRWCTQDQLICHQTPGGHRRIPFRALMDFSKAKNMECDFHVFNGYAESVWKGMLDVEKKKEYSTLVKLGVQWIQGTEFHYMLELLTYLKNQGTPLASQMDEVIAPIMRTIGTSYLQGELSIGHEHRVTYLMRDLLVRMSIALETSRPHDRPSPPPKAVLGCIRSQAHELGCLMAKLVLESHGWDVVYLGLNVPTEEFAKIQVEYGASMICVALMPPSTQPEVQHLIELLGQVYNRSVPYHLVLGGPVELKLPPSKTTQSPITSIQYFERMKGFSDWLQDLPSAPPQEHSIYANSSGLDNNSLKRSLR